MAQVLPGQIHCLFSTLQQIRPLHDLRLGEASHPSLQAGRLPDDAIK